MFPAERISLDLRLFDGAAAGAAGGGEGSTGVQAADAGPQTGVKEGGAKSAAETPAAGEGTGKVADRRTQFRALIEGEYKDLFGEEVRGIVDKRLKETEKAVQREKATRPIIATLSTKYGVDGADLDALSAAIDEDEYFFEEAARKLDMSIPQYKNMLRDKREIETLRGQLEAKDNQEEAQRILARWELESERVKSVYPSYELRKELANPAFEKLLNAGVDVRTAYEVVHKDEIIPAAMQFTAQQTAAKIGNAIQENRSRPAEGALGGQAAVVTKRDVNNMTKAERQELIRRARRGERIEL